MAVRLDSLTKPKRLSDIHITEEAKATQTATSLMSRFGKQIANIIPESSQEVMYGLGGMKVMSWPMAFMLSRKAKERGVDLGIRDAHTLLKQGFLEETEKFLPAFKVEAPTTTPEKITDVAAGVTKFAVELAALKKVMPGVSDKALWEMQNLISGGTPGEGAAMHTLFALPSKIIPGKSILARGSRVATESALLGSASVLEQKVTTGEIDWKDVAIQAGIPPALHSIGYVSKRIKSGDKKVIEAAKVVEAKESNLYHGTSKESLMAIEKEGFKGEVSLSLNPDASIFHAKKKGTKNPVVLDIRLRPDAKIFTSKDIPKDMDYITLWKLNKYAKENGYDGINIAELESKGLVRTIKDEKLGKEYEVRIFNPEVIQINKTKGTTFAKEPNLYKTTDGKETGLTEADIYLDKTTGKWLSNKTNKDVTLDVHAKPETEFDTVKKGLEDWSDKAKKISREEWEPEVKKLRAKQIQHSQEILEKAKSEGVSSQERLRRIKAGFKHKAVRPEVEPPKFTNEQWNSISKQAEITYGNDTPKLMNLQESVDRLRFEGKIPTDYEFGLLEPVLGTETVTKLYENLAQQRTFSKWDAPKLIISALKSPFGFDPQAARQLISILPKYPKVWWDSLKLNLRTYVSKTAANKLAKELESRPSWRLAQEAGVNLVGTKPWTATEKSGKRLQQYGDWTNFLVSRKNRVLKGIGKWLQASERGANLGIDYALLTIWEREARVLERVASRKGWNEKQISLYERRKAKDINAFTKRVIARNPKARQIQAAANMVMFSPAYTISRPYSSWKAISNLFRKGPIDRFYAIDLTLRNIAMLQAMSTVGTLTAYKLRNQNPDEEPKIQSSMDPTNALWGKLRVDNQVIDLSFGDASYYRLLARLGVSAYAYAKEKATGQIVSKVGKTPVREAGEELRRYLASRETVALGLGKTLLTGKDWLGQPVEWKSFLATSAMPMSALKELIEAGLADGLWESLYNKYLAKVGQAALRDVPTAGLGMLGVGVSSYPINPVTLRANLRDVIANSKYSKDWNNLTPSEQRKLERIHKDKFTELDKKIAEARLEKPVNVQRIIEEEKKAGDRIRKQLTPENQLKTVGVSLNLSRRPKKFYLNDERFNRYSDLIVEILNKKLSKLNNPRQNVVEAVIRIAKIQAWAKLQREMR